MERQSRRGRNLAIAALVLICTALGTVGGAVAGGVAGYLLARREVRAAAARPAVQLPDEMWRLLPSPANPGLPETPPVPRDWPFDGPQGAQPFGIAMSAEVATVVAGSPAEAAGLRAGDRITAVDGEELSFSHDLAQALASHRPGERVELTVTRANGGDRAGEEIVEVTLGENPDNASRPYLGLTYRMVFSRQVDGPRPESG